MHFFITTKSSLFISWIYSLPLFFPFFVIVLFSFISSVLFFSSSSLQFFSFMFLHCPKINLNLSVKPSLSRLEQKQPRFMFKQIWHINQIYTVAPPPTVKISVFMRRFGLFFGTVCTVLPFSYSILFPPWRNDSHSSCLQYPVVRTEILFLDVIAIKIHS